MNYEDTRIYQRAVELNARAGEVVLALPPGFGFLADQIRRASTSVIMNFHEGCSRETPKERRRYFIIARGSAMEVSAAVDAAFAHQAIPQELRADLKSICHHVAAMLMLFR